jgi:2,4,7-trihydroxy-1,4-benzoxazin-3-one-glucoside 7-O-methyltransferase
MQGAHWSYQCDGAKALSNIYIQLIHINSVQQKNKHYHILQIMAHQECAGDPYDELKARHTANTEELREAHHELWGHAGYVKSMALKCALDLRIPGTIQRCGGAATLGEIVAASDLPASSLPYLRRLMRTLTAMRIFAISHDPDNNPGDDDVVVSYQLTPTSRLLLSGGDDASYFTLLSTIYPVVQQGLVSPMFSMSDWMKHHHAPAMSLYEMEHGKGVWECVQGNAAYRASFYDSMDAHTRLVMHVVLSECPAVFHGLTSVVDVGGGRGTAAAAIAIAFPHIKCTVMDLPHVIAEAPVGTGLCFLVGDMFEHIPPADALLLKVYIFRICSIFRFYT